MIGVDETRNRVMVGVENAEAAAQVRDVIARMGIPGEAVLIEITGPIRLDVGSAEPLAPAGTHTLQSNLPEEEGGIQIRKDAGTQGRCTLGFNVDLGGARAFVTNSHCTNTAYGGTNNTTFYQPDYCTGCAIGTESRDVADKGCDPDYNCRYSDSALATYGSTVSWVWRGIAHPTCSSTFGGNSGCIDIDHTTPHFFIIAKQSYPYIGDSTEQVGKSSGWTWGEVNAACDDYLVGSTVLRCQYKLSQGSADGDSGAPVFLWHGGTDITLYGVHWGNLNGDSLISPMGGIEKDLGSLTVL